MTASAPNLTGPDPERLSPRDYALAAISLDVAVLPPKSDGTKMPIAEPWVDREGKPIIDPSKERQGYGWKHRETIRAKPTDVDRWFASGRRTDFGIVCGAVSGKLEPLPDGLIGPPTILGLEMVEFEQRERWDALGDLAHQIGLGALIERIAAGYLSETPGGGVHTLIRCSEYESNLKLAFRPATEAELAAKPEEDRKVIAETRGEGGYTVEPPSSGSVHPSGKPYRLVRGGLSTIVTLMPEERQTFLDLIRSFNELPDDAPTTSEDDTRGRGAHGKPGWFDPTTNYSGPTALDVIAAYNARTTWDELLSRHGWRLLGSSSAGVGFWARPGKSDPGWSATTHYGSSDKLCVFSTTPKLKVTDRKGSRAGYDRFGFFAAVEHGGDNKAAVRAASVMLGMNERRNGHATGPTLEFDEDDASQPGVSEIPWPDPERRLDLPAAPALDLSLFPPEVANVALDAAERLQCPPDYVAWGLTVCLAGLMGRGVGVRPRQFDDWTERACLWVALVGEPSWMKSPALEVARRPLKRQDALDHQRHEYDLAAWEAECDEIRAAAKKGEKPKLPPKPVEVRRVTSDATIEKLADLMAPSPGLTLIRDEIAGWVGAFNRYTRAEGDRQFFLETYSGGPYTVDRISRGTVRVPDTYLGILGGAQPDRAREIFGEGPDDGFAARVTAVYPEMPPTWKEVDRWPDRDARDALDAVCDRLVAADWPALLPSDDWKPLPYCRLDREAGALWSEWHTSTMVALRAGTWEGRHAGRVGKYPGLAARLVLVWHLVGWAAGRVADDALGRVPALTLARVLDLMDGYVHPMDDRVYRAFDRTAAATGAERIARWITATRPASFTLRDVRRREWSGLTDPVTVVVAVEWLAAKGWVREADQEQRPGRPANRYVVNPRVWEVPS